VHEGFAIALFGETMAVKKIALGETPARKGPARRVLLIRGAETDKGVFIRSRGARGENVELCCDSEAVAQRKFLLLKIARILFPKNFPKAVGVRGNVLYSKYVVPHRELGDLFKTSTNHFIVLDKLSYRHKANRTAVEEFRKKCHAAGLFPDLSPTNVAFKKGGIVAYEVDYVDPAALRLALEKMPILESRKKAVNALLDRLVSAKLGIYPFSGK
jgi:hypothetical protein